MLPHAFFAVLSNYNRMTAYICRPFIPTTAFFSLTAFHSKVSQVPRNLWDNWRRLSIANCPSCCQTNTIDSLEVKNYATTTTVLRPFFWDHPGELVPEENFWTLWCKGRLTEADMGATTSRLSSAHLHHLPLFTGQMPFLPPNQQCQNTKGNVKNYATIENEI